MILVDTNLLIRLADQASPQRAVAKKALLSLAARNETLFISAQSIYEFRVVATRATGRSNGLGMPCDRVDLWLNFLLRRFTLIPESPELLWLGESWSLSTKSLGSKPMTPALSPPCRFMVSSNF